MTEFAMGFNSLLRIKQMTEKGKRFWFKMFWAHRRGWMERLKMRSDGASPQLAWRLLAACAGDSNSCETVKSQENQAKRTILFLSENNRCF